MKDSILLVDDDTGIQRLFSKILTEHGYSVSIADSGLEALKLLETHTYQLILLDLKMPGMSGIETLREIRKKNTRVPVYIVTAFENAYFEEIKQIREDDIEFELLHKPLNKSELLHIVDSLLGK